MPQTKVIGGVGQGTTQPGFEWIIDPLYGAGRVTLRPLDYTWPPGIVLGHFRAVGTTSALAFGASANLAALRWTDTSRFFVPLRIRAAVSVVTAVTAQRVDPLLAFIARQYTARDATGATAIAFSATNTQKMRSNMGQSILGATGNFDVTSAVGGVTAGTKVVDTSAFGMLALPGLGALGTAASGDLYVATIASGEHPPVLGLNEGILVQWGATVLGTGTAELTVEVTWAEVAAF